MEKVKYSDGGMAGNMEAHIKTIRDILIAGDLVEINEGGGVLNGEIFDVERCESRQWEVDNIVSIYEEGGVWREAVILRLGGGASSQRASALVQFADDGSKANRDISNFCPSGTSGNSEPIEIKVKLDDSGSIRSFKKNVPIKSPDNLNNVSPRYIEDEFGVKILNKDGGYRTTSIQSFQSTLKRSDDRKKRVEEVNRTGQAVLGAAVGSVANTLTAGFSGGITAGVGAAKSESKIIKLEREIKSLNEKIDRNRIDIDTCCSDNILRNKLSDESPKSPEALLQLKDRSQSGNSPFGSSGSDTEGSPQQSSGDIVSTQDPRINTHPFSQEQYDSILEEDTGGARGSAGGGKYKHKGKSKRINKSNRKKKNKTKRRKKTKHKKTRRNKKTKRR